MLVFAAAVVLAYPLSGGVATLRSNNNDNDKDGKGGGQEAQQQLGQQLGLWSWQQLGQQGTLALPLSGATATAPAEAVPAQSLAREATDLREFGTQSPEPALEKWPSWWTRDHNAASATRAQVLVVVSDHGSGTSSLGKALKTHPCVYDMNEPFGRDYMLWATSPVAECAEVDFEPHAIFDADSGKLMNTNNPKLVMHLPSIRNEPLNIDMDDPSLYKDLKYDLAEYFVRVRDLVCGAVPADVCPPSNCTITLKMFPQYVNAVTEGLYTVDDVPRAAGAACENAQNDKAMEVWKAALASFEKNPKVAILALNRDELQRQFSMFHRFSKAGTKFDCSLERTPTEFATVAKGYADLPMRSEQVWEDPDKSLGNVLNLVGLRIEPMEGKGTQIITAELDQRASLGKLASQSCSTDPLAIFERLKNSDVRMTAHASAHTSPGRELAGGEQDEDELLAEQSSRYAEAVKEAIHEDEAERQAAKPVTKPVEKPVEERSSAEKAAAEKAAAEKAAAEKAAAEKAAAEKAAAEKAAADKVAAEKVAAKKAASVTEAEEATEAAAAQRELVAASDQDQYLFWPSYVRRGSAYIRSTAIAP